MGAPGSPRASSAGIRISIHGAVQGVGFRPFVFRLATELGLCGWVGNDNRGVTLEVQGEREALERLLRRLPLERPAASVITGLEHVWIAPMGASTFEIRASSADGFKTAEILPDLATCPACLAEVLDPL